MFVIIWLSFTLWLVHKYYSILIIYCNLSPFSIIFFFIFQLWLDPLFFRKTNFPSSLHFMHRFLGFNLLSMILFYPTCIYYCQTQLSQSFHRSQPICCPMFNFHGFQLFSVTPLLWFNFLGFSNMFKIQEFFCDIQISYYVHDVQSHFVVYKQMNDIMHIFWYRLTIFQWQHKTCTFWKWLFVNQWQSYKLQLLR